MSIQNVASSTAALNAQLLEQQQSGAASFNNQNLPQLTSDQVQNLQQALQNDVRQAFSSGASGGNVQTQLDNSVSSTLSQAGFSQNQVQSFLDKINQGFGASSRGGRGHAAHHARHAVNNLIQTLQSNTAGQSSSGTSTSSTTSNNLLTSSVSGSPSTTAGQSIDLAA
jgi:hypothetical protein